MKTGWIARGLYEQAKSLDPKCRILAAGRRSVKVAYTVDAVDELVIGRG